MTIAALTVRLASPVAAPLRRRGTRVTRSSRGRRARRPHSWGLSRAPVAPRTSGRFGDGKTTHTFESFRRGGDSR